MIVQKIDLIKIKKAVGQKRCKRPEAKTLKQMKK